MGQDVFGPEGSRQGGGLAVSRGHLEGPDGAKPAWLWFGVPPSDPRLLPGPPFPPLSEGLGVGGPEAPLQLHPAGPRNGPAEPGRGGGRRCGGRGAGESGLARRRGRFRRSGASPASVLTTWPAGGAHLLGAGVTGRRPGEGGPAEGWPSPPGTPTGPCPAPPVLATGSGEKGGTHRYLGGQVHVYVLPFQLLTGYHSVAV